MGLPVLEQPYLERVRLNIKTPREEGISSFGKPSWLTIKPPSQEFYTLKQKLRSAGLVTVCQESHCPNMAECWSTGTATFMVLGDTCTRACKFCNVKARGQPGPVDPSEPQKLVQAVKEMQLDYVVITSVDRDDLPDGGAQHFADCITALKQAYPGLLVEVLIGDFQGNTDHLKIIVDSKPTVISHNVETIDKLQATVRDRRANYQQSIGVLRNVKQFDPTIKTKTSFMTGLGETHDDLLQAMDDVRQAGCDIITFGQYLRPSNWHLPVEKYWHPDEFKALEQAARQKGFLYCAAGPFVRSSYKAAELFMKGLIASEVQS